MRRLSFLLILIATFSSRSFSQTPEIEFVESIPIETTLDNPDIPDAHGVWIAMINRARKSLDIEQFYISDQKGEPLEGVLVAIVQAAGRGVNVRILVDSRMYRTYPETVDSLGKQKNITSRVIDIGKQAGGIQHAKFFIVDGEEIFLGSQNFDWRALKHIHELGLRIRHKDLVKVYQDIFELDWNAAEKNEKLVPSPRSYPTQFSFVRSDGDTVVLRPTMSPKSFIYDSVLWDEPNILELLNSAKREIDLQFLSYSNIGRDKSRYDSLDSALRRAAARGVNVRMIVSDWDKGAPDDAPFKSLVKVPSIQVKFSVIPDWSAGYIPYARVDHCKFINVDGKKFWLGTSNAEKSYFYTSRNLGIIVENDSLAEKLHAIFMKSWESPYTEPVNPETQYKQREHGEKK